MATEEVTKKFFVTFCVTIVPFVFAFPDSQRSSPRVTNSG